MHIYRHKCLNATGYSVRTLQNITLNIATCVLRLIATLRIEPSYMYIYLELDIYRIHAGFQYCSSWFEKVQVFFYICRHKFSEF